MNIEEDLTSLKEIVAIRKERCHGFIESDSCFISTKRLETLLTAYEKEKEKNKELEEKIIHRYKRICPECNNSFIAKRNNTKYCQKCGKKVARRKYKEANKEKIREYSKLHMRKYRAKKKLLKEE